MCCTPLRHTDTQRFGAASPDNCGCGCIGPNTSKIQLETYRDHLKVEMKAVEKRIKELDDVPS
jgi:hypothetical protein